MSRREGDIFPYRSTLEQRAYEQSRIQSRTSRRRFLAGAGVAVAVTGALVLTGKGEEVLASISREDKGPTDEQKEVYNHLVVERFDVIPNFVLVGEPSLPSKLRNKPYTPRDYDKPVGKVITRIGKTIFVGDGFVVLGDDPNEQHRTSNKDPWIAILNPVRDKSRAPRPEDVVFSHYGNFALTPEQLIQVKKAAERLAA